MLFVFLGAGASAALFGQSGKARSIAVLAPEGRGLSSYERYLPELAAGVLISNFSRYSDLAVLDRQNLEKIIGETESGIYKSGADFIRLGEIAGVDYALAGSITKTQRGFLLNFTVTDAKTGLTAAAYSASCAASKLEDSSAIHKAARDLIRQLKARPKRAGTQTGADERKQKRLYAGARAGAAIKNAALNTNRDDIQAEVQSAFEGALQIEWHLFDFTRLKTPPQFSIQTELIFSVDTVSASLPDGTKTTLEGAALTVPFLAKLSWKPRKFYTAVFTGPAAVLPLGRMAVTQNGAEERFDFSPTAGWMAGAAAGFNLGTGALFADARYYGDFMFVRVNDVPQYRRQTFSVSLGYIFGFLPMEKKR